VDPQRNIPGDQDQRWFEGGDWNRGRHGAPADGNGSYQGAEAEYTGAFEPSSSPPAQTPAHTLAHASAPDPAEVQRRTTESIDVGAMRRPPVSSPPAAYPPPVSSPPPAYPPPPAYGGGQEQPLYQGASNAGPEQSLYQGASNAVPEQPLYPPPAQSPLGAPTAAVHTVPPPRQPGHLHGSGPSVYQSRKPVVMVALIALTVLFEIPALRLLASATLDDHVPANGVVAGTFLVLGIPVFAYGLYGMLGGGPVPEKLSAWLKQPLIYVPLGVLLFLFAALAA